MHILEKNAYLVKNLKKMAVFQYLHAFLPLCFTALLPYYLPACLPVWLATNH
jgi:hypothetical protein